MEKATMSAIEHKMMKNLKMAHEYLINQKVKHDQTLAWNSKGEMTTVKARDMRHIPEARWQ